MLTSSPPARTVTVYVSPAGNDSWSGTRPVHRASAGPFATLAGARDAVRRLGATRAKVRVVIAGGTYRLAAPVVFDARDGAASGHPVTFEAAAGARPAFRGSARLHPTPVAGGLWTMATVGGARLEQLWVNGRRAERESLPATGWLSMAGTVGTAIDPATGKTADLSHRAFRAQPAVVSALSGLTQADLHRVVAVVYHAWEVSRLPVRSVDPQTGTIYLGGESPWPFGQWAANQPYTLENFPTERPTEGCWYQREDGTVLYTPLAGERAASAVVEAPIAPAFVVIAGTGSRPVSGITFRGLTFEYSGWTMEPGGHADAQAAYTIPAAIQVDHATGIRFERCSVRHTGVYAVWYRRGCVDCAVAGCVLDDLGAGGVRIGEGEIRPDGVDRTGHCSVTDTVIRHGGRIFPGAVGVWIGQSANNDVEHNDIGDLLYTAVSVGWTWGYGPSLARGNRIAWNRLHDLGQGVLSDMGAVYTLGISDGTRVDHNVVSRVSCRMYGGWGLYNDEGSSHILLDHNLVTDVQSGSYHQHYGEENVIRNNIFAFSREGQLQRSRVEARVPFTFERNIVVWRKSWLLNGTWTDTRPVLRDNLYWEYGAAPATVRFGALDFAQWQATGKDAGSVIADPLFRDADHGDFTLSAASPALRLGFEPFDLRRAGVRPGA